jgi:adenylate kinase
MRLLMLAPPGAGKGTQADRLSQRFGIEHISSGDLLRKEVAEATPVGMLAKSYLDQGDLVPDEVVMKMILDRIVDADTRGGYILDGFPRNLRQAERAYEVAKDLGLTLDAAIYLDVSHDESIRRLLDRHGTQGRADDSEATIRHRLEVFETATLPLLQYYLDRGVLIRINGEQPVDAVTEEILEALAGRGL